MEVPYLPCSISHQMSTKWNLKPLLSVFQNGIMGLKTAKNNEGIIFELEIITNVLHIVI